MAGMEIYLVIIPSTGSYYLLLIQDICQYNKNAKKFDVQVQPYQP